MALLVSTVKTQFGLLKRDITDVSNDTFVQWCRFVNDYVYRYLIDIAPNEYWSTSTITTTSGTSAYALPSDFRDMSVSGGGIYCVDDNSNVLDTRLALTNYGAREKGYYISGSNIVMTPEPTQTETYSLRYIPENTVIDAVTDYFTIDTLSTGAEIIPERYLDYLIKALDVYYNYWDEQPGAESLSDQRFVRSLNELAQAIRPEGGMYSLPEQTFFY